MTTRGHPHAVSTPLPIAASDGGAYFASRARVRWVRSGYGPPPVNAGAFRDFLADFLRAKSRGLLRGAGIGTAGQSTGRRLESCLGSSGGSSNTSDRHVTDATVW